MRILTLNGLLKIRAKRKILTQKRGGFLPITAGNGIAGFIQHVNIGGSGNLVNGLQILI